MQLGEVFERFIQQAPISVMFRTLLEHALDPAEIDRLFEDHATRQYTREVLFSSIVELMGAVVCGAQPSVRAAYNQVIREVPTIHLFGARPLLHPDSCACGLPDHEYAPRP